ncbi:MAG: hypothetical protein AB1Z98_09125 [Nannocystaceae bacterium]
MVWTIFARDPETGARGLVIEVRSDLVADDGTVPTVEADALRRRLFDRSMRVGLLVTPRHVLVVRDRLTSMTFVDNEFATYTIPTGRLFDAAHVGTPSADTLLDQVRSWLEALAESWDTRLPADAFEAFVPDVVGHLVRADIEVHEGLLPMDHAAE